MQERGMLRICHGLSSLLDPSADIRGGAKLTRDRSPRHFFFLLLRLIRISHNWMAYGLRKESD